MSILKDLIKKIFVKDNFEVTVAEPSQVTPKTKSKTKKVLPKKVIVSGEEFVKDYVDYVQAVESINQILSEFKKKIVSVVIPVYATEYRKEHVAGRTLTSVDVSDGTSNDCVRLQFKKAYKATTLDELKSLNEKIGLGLGDGDLAKETTKYTIDLKFLIRPDGSTDLEKLDKIVKSFSEFGAEVSKDVTVTPSEKFHEALWTKAKADDLKGVIEQLGQTIAFGIEYGE